MSLRSRAVGRCLVGQECPTHTGSACYAGRASQTGIAGFHDFADDLVARNYLVVEGREFALGDVQVSAADSAGKDAEEDMVNGGSGDGDVFDFEWAIGDW